MQSNRTITINLSTGTAVDIILTCESAGYDMVNECKYNLIDSDIDISGLTEDEINEAEKEAEILKDRWSDEIESGEDLDDDSDEDLDEYWDE